MMLRATHHYPTGRLNYTVLSSLMIALLSVAVPIPRSDTLASTGDILDLQGLVANAVPRQADADGPAWSVSDFQRALAASLPQAATTDSSESPAYTLATRATRAVPRSPFHQCDLFQPEQSAEDAPRRIRPGAVHATASIAPPAHRYWLHHMPHAPPRQTEFAASSIRKC